MRSPEDAARVESIFGEAIEIDTEARSAFLDESCGDDPHVRAEVESLLVSFDTHAARVRRLFERLPLASSTSQNRDAERNGHRTRSLTGSQVGHYRVLDELGGGGMGVVYQAYDPRLDRMLALKFLPPRLHASDAAKTRFNQEARAASALDHPNICTVHDIGETEEGQLYIAMSYYPGETIKKKIARGKLDVSEALPLAIQAASGIVKAHSAGIIHRDIKPANLLVTEADTVKIVDFGIAKFQSSKLTKTGATLGTVAYMSPEQARGEEVDQRSDIWSLGAVLYEMLTGMPPFSGESDAALIYSVLKAEPDLELIDDAGARAVVEVCLRKDPEDRFASASELENALRSVAGGLGVAALPLPRRRRRTAAAVMGLAVLAVTAVTVTTWFFTRDRPGPAPGPQKREMLVVLPFENRGDAADQYFADGVAEELSMRLSSIRSIGVISRNTANNYRETKKTTAEIGNELGVDYVVGGTVQWVEQPNGSRSVRIAPYLTRVSDDTQVWAEAYDRRTADVLDVQKTLALNIAQKVTTTLDPAEVEQMQEDLTSSPDAYQEYLKGMATLKEPLPQDSLHAFSSMANAEDERGLRAIAHFQKALELDSTFVEAAYRMSRVASGLVQRDDLHPDREAGEHMRHLASEGAQWTRRMAPNSRADLLANGYYDMLVLKDWGGAMGLLGRALDLFEDAEVLSSVAWIQNNLGNFEFAVDYTDRAFELEPRNVGFLLQNVRRFHYLRRFPKALEYLNRAMEIDSTFAPYCSTTHGILANMINIDLNTKRARAMVNRPGWHDARGQRQGEVPNCMILDFWDRNWDRLAALADSGFTGRGSWMALVPAYQKLGQKDKLRQIYEQMRDYAAESHAVNVWGFQAQAEAGLGNREEALSKLHDFKDWVSNHGSKGLELTNYNTFAAGVYLTLGMKDELFEVLEDDASHPGWMNVAWLQTGYFDSVRDDPRFDKVVAKFAKWEENWR